MALPLNPTPVYNTKVPSTGQKIKYRPFTVKDEKALLIAQQAEDSEVMYDTIKDVLKRRIESDVDVDSFASFDVEYLLVVLRTVSVGEHVDLVFHCDCQEENNTIPVRVDLRDVYVNNLKGHEKKLHLFDDVGVVLKYPRLQDIKAFEQAEATDGIINLVANCIDYIYNTDEVMKGDEYTEQERIKFIEALSPVQFQQIEKFFTTMPSVRLDISYSCPCCDKEYKTHVEGFDNFF